MSEKTQKHSGTIKFYNDQGYGFIDQDHTDQDAYLHIKKFKNYDTMTSEDENELLKGTRVEYETRETPDGIAAINIELENGELGSGGGAPSQGQEDQQTEKDKEQAGAGGAESDSEEEGSSNEDEDDVGSGEISDEKIADTQAQLQDERQPAGV